MDPLWVQINEAIHRRDLQSVKQLIPRYLRSHRSSPEATYEASEFYRKITDYKSALRVLPSERAQSRSRIISEAETRLELQLARILNVLGASNYALRMIGQIRAEGRAKSKIEMVEIYHSNYRFTDVVELLGIDYPVPDSEPWHQDWLLHFYLSYALGELKRTDLAIQRMERIRAISKSPLIQAMTLSYTGKYWLIAGETPKALSTLLQSQRFFRDDDETADHANFQTFLGECFLRLERFPEAEKALRRALHTLVQPAIKPEEWIEAALLLDRVPGVREKERLLAPRLRAISGSEYPPLLIADRDELGSEDQIFSISKIERDRKTRHFDRGSDMFWRGQTPRLGIDLVDELIYNLIYAGEYGLPQFRLYELLWPNEPFSFDQHHKRLERVVSRARAQGYKIHWKSFHLRLLSVDVTATGRPERAIRGRSFLLEHPVFTRRDVEKYFSISNTSAKALCREWLKRGFTDSEKGQYRSKVR